MQWFINSNKDEGQRPQHLKDGNDPARSQLIRLYASYEEACARAGVVDFDEFLLRAYELWRDHPPLLEHYRRRFRHVLVDEFQDTNAIQYAWMRLSPARTAICLLSGMMTNVLQSARWSLWQTARNDPLKQSPPAIWCCRATAAARSDLRK